MAKTRTDEARRQLALGHGPKAVAERTGLHDAYVRKLIHRDEARDFATAAWRRDNPDKVATYRAKQNRDRLEARRARRVAGATEDGAMTDHRQRLLAMTDK